VRSSNTRLQQRCVGPVLPDPCEPKRLLRGAFTCCVSKDRSRVEHPGPGVRIHIMRSSTHPVEYAVVIVVWREGRWHTVRTFDNAHDAEEHHEHGYIGAEKQPPTVTHGPINEAMHAAIVMARRWWADVVDAWERTRCRPTARYSYSAGAGSTSRHSHSRRQPRRKPAEGSQHERRCTTRDVDRAGGARRIVRRRSRMHERTRDRTRPQQRAGPEPGATARSRPARRAPRRRRHPR
jgi:hypothetical protein